MPDPRAAERTGVRLERYGFSQILSVGAPVSVCQIAVTTIIL